MKATNKLFLLLLASVLSFTSCMSPLGDLNNAEKKIGREAKAKFDEYRNKLENHDLANIQDFYSESENFKWIVRRGIDSIQVENEFSSAGDLAKFVQTNYAGNELTTIKTIYPKSVHVKDESHVMVFMSYEQLMKDSKGVKTKYFGNFLIHMQKEDGEWKFVTGDDQRVEIIQD